VWKAAWIAVLCLAAAAAARAEEMTYSVTATFYEPDTQPRNTIFVGYFDYDADTQTVSNLHGLLSESMTGDPVPYPDDDMSWLTLDHQLSAIYDPTLGGLLVTTFRNADTDTFTTLFGGDGWSPDSHQGTGLYYGYPGPNPANAYARIFVDIADPTTPPTQARIDGLAYADCAPGGMMGATCMTGTTVAGYGSLGTMGGHPVSQEVTLIPEPETRVLVPAGIGMLVLLARLRRGSR